MNKLFVTSKSLVSGSGQLNLAFKIPGVIPVFALFFIKGISILTVAYLFIPTTLLSPLSKIVLVELLILSECNKEKSRLIQLLVTLSFIE